MKIETKVTERDKKLLLILAYFLVIVVLGFLGIRPLLELNQKTDEELEEARAEKQEILLKIEELPVLRATEAGLAADIEQLRDIFYPKMSASQVDKMRTGSALEDGLTVTRLDLDMRGYGTPIELINYNSLLESKFNGIEAEKETFDGVYPMEVVLQMTGRRDMLQGQLDKLIDDEPRLRVRGFSWQKQDIRDIRYRDNIDDLKNVDIGLQVELSMYTTADLETLQRFHEVAEAAEESEKEDEN